MGAMEMRHTFWIVLIVCSSVLPGLSGCAENEVVRLSSNGSSYRVELPERWNGRFMVLFTDAISPSVSLTWRNLVAAGYAVAEVNGAPSDTRSVPADVGRLRVHFVLSTGRPKGAYLVGASLGAEIALVTILVDEGRFDGESGVVSPGFVRPNSSDISAETVEEQLSWDESATIILANRLQTERGELAEDLVFYYTLLSDLHRDGSAEPHIPALLQIDTAAILSRLLGSVS